MKKYNVTGMSCAACSSRVEKAVLSVDGVVDCSVNLLTNSVSVEGSFSDEEIKTAVISAGYGISEEKNHQEENQTLKIKKRLISSVILLVILMYFSMGKMIFLPLPSSLMLNGCIQFVLALTIIIINRKFFINGVKGVLNKAPNMDTLVAIGSGASFIYSAVSLVTNNFMDFYFDSSAMILTLITVGKMLEERAKGKTTNAIKGLMGLKPQTAVLIKEDKEVIVLIDEIKKGDIFAVKPGESFPADGKVVSGESSVNESALTGESIPLDKKAGDNVFTATVNLSGYLRCEATSVGEDTLLSKIIKTVTDASSQKAPVAKIADKVAGVFVPSVMLISILTLIIWLMCGKSVGFALARAVSVLVISCPCALGLATPVAIMVGSGMGAKNGILFKTATSLEETGKIKYAVLDKTGTVTKGEPEVTDILPLDITEEELLKIAYSLEIKSEHPLGRAIVHEAEKTDSGKYELSDFKALSGSGVEGIYDSRRLIGGNMKFVSGEAEIPKECEKTAKELSEQGKTPLFFAVDSKLIGVIAVADALKEDSVNAISRLEKMKIEVIMLTGDNEKTAKAIADRAGIEKVIAGVLPDKKAEVISELKNKGKVLMVGDGINDAPALTVADTGMAIGAGSDIAIDSADVVLINSKLSDVASAIALSRKTLKNIKENLFWAFIYNIICIPVAAGVFIPLNGFALSPMLGAAAMSMSSLFVVSNALRLNFCNLNERKNKKMEKVFKVEGMMCPHCEAHVKKALEEINGVKEVVADHKAATVTVVFDGEVSDELIKKTVDAQGYKFIK